MSHSLSHYTGWKLQQFRRLFYSGAVFAYPTEAVYGLGCDPWNYAALSSLLELKQRSMSKGVILLATTKEQLAPFVSLKSNANWSKLEVGNDKKPTTWIVPASAECPVWIRGAHTTVAVRLTNFPPVVALCGAVGSALVSTSANRSGHPALKSALMVEAEFGLELDQIMVGNCGGSDRASEIIELNSGKRIR
ncbi:MAG: tRNA threonylcarbamoyladenosine biosynthesis protein RimN [Thiotrichales bacterium]|jgi:L-threonylcarbamoyladenylate synthase|nr:tRNA threonylcarbamoyladenosine biosynthesis protein RimN [Thiotrichales bacterium]MBT3612988.1 tRNA threonylcarbamoyladenosine biosynthesis protein RimN [Thiotrichales bacterium]MBT3752670.1 tRNA threonylcarbamoyladenosine biosynthesis protein RimN [Thiotrichales bacterium]MBT3838208.1 tRNA threonylcarbamoyladenosine biosynthesis protein RimN [Thiotrichales bacterium]MBT4152245.1 tRNA threonylcarbamoyladenosine biosynthesis protein RimN [Thiotrichales bacterium]